jgi:phage repressor protein C with HTH and peptisase S24 domain
MIAFKVRGDSMWPVFKDGHVIVVFKEQKKPIDSFFGLDAAVRTADGRRFIKTITRGASGVTLTSWNAAPIEDVSLEWVGEIFASLPPAALKKTVRNGGVQGQLQLKAS